MLELQQTLFLGLCAPICLAVSVLTAACGSSDGASNTNANGASAGGSRDAGEAAAGGVNASGGATSSGGVSGTTGTGGAPSSGGAQNGDASGNVGTIDCREDGDGTTTLVFVNQCSSSLTFRGSDIAGGALSPGAFACVDIGTDTDELSAKRYWGFLEEDPGPEHYTLAEFTFNTDFNDFDWYNMSHVDAHNVPMQIAPVARPMCDTLTCAENLLANCPEVGQVRNANGDVISCVSPDRDDGGSVVALYFESCDDAYAWSGDDQNGDDPSPVRACAGEDFDITFCPREGQ